MRKLILTTAAVAAVIGLAGCGKDVADTWIGIPHKCGTDGTADSCKTVSIGGQTWMAENLNREMGNSRCYQNKRSNCDKYGRLYDWETAKTVCPSGWKLPDTADWSKLVRTVSGHDTIINMGDEFFKMSLDVAKKLKSKSGWNNRYAPLFDFKWSSGNGTDDYGFSALPGSGYYPGGGSYNAGYYGFWWMATEYNNDYAYHLSISYDYDHLPELYGNTKKVLGFSVRCVADTP